MANWINICFVIDESGSMYPSVDDVVGGFKSIIDEQKKNKDGRVTVSLYTFSDNVRELYRGVDINEIDEFKYSPNGMTALYDGVGTAIDNIGKWLHDKDQHHEEMPAKTMFVIMTDGEENYSKEYKLQDIQNKIKTQTDVYSWEFLYVGTDLTKKTQANTMGFSNQFYSTRKKSRKMWDAINCAATCYRAEVDASSAAKTLATTLTGLSETLNMEYEADTGIKLED